MSGVRAIDELFGELIELESPQQRQEFLDRIEKDDAALRQQLEKLLAAHDRAGSFLGEEDVDATFVFQRDELIGTNIGPYKIREQIGYGGMGVVYVAEQQKPLRRKVALKVIKPGMDSKAVLARFDAERNALALMNHPNIAKVLDAGTTDHGHPYFLMELIQGQPITEYCDQKRLTIPRRLQLFTHICNAVQHAHQKGVIHRDIKPTNILVTEIDGKPVPKVIDFGVAKALGANLTDRTMYTSFHALVGTPLYMSPEQTELSGVDVDTSSDVYSLGILLYELLTGTTPLSPQELKQAAQDEVLRRIRETEPPRPSNRISSLGETSSQVSECRGAQPEQLDRLVRGDLDWIVMKALEKDRNRRYKTADAFASDIGRHLASEPVEARPPSTAYRLSRFYRRNRVTVIFATLLLGILTIAVPVTAIGWRQAWIEREALQSTLDELWSVLADYAIDSTFGGDFHVATEAIERLNSAKAPEELVKTLRGISLLIAGDSQPALDQLESTAERNPQSVMALSALSWAYLHESEYGMHEATQNRVQLLLKNRPNLSDFDRIFLSLSEFVDGNQQMLKDNLGRIDDLVERKHNWGVAYLLRAKLRAELAREDKDIQQFRRAIDDFELAYERLHGSTFAVSEGLMIFVDGIALAEDQGRMAEQAEWSQKATDIVEKLEPSGMSERGLSNLACFHFHYGNCSTAEQIEADLIARADQEWIVASEKLDYSTIKAPLSTWRKAKDDGGLQTCLALTLACSQPSQKDRLEIESIVDRAIEDGTSTAGYALLTDIALVLGNDDMLRKLCDAAAQGDSFEADYRWLRRYVEFQRGDLLEEDFLTLAEPFPYTSTLAYYGIAMKALSDGKDDKAREYFRKTVDTHTVSYWCYHNARCFLRRLENGWNPTRKR